MTSTGDPAPPAVAASGRKRTRQTKAQPLNIYPKLPTPTGAEVEALRLQMGWTLAQAAGVADLCDGSAVKEIESNNRRMNNARWTMMLLAANRHPTLQLVVRGHGQDPEKPAC